MVEVNGRPIMMHVMDIYSYWGFKEFVVAGGYKVNSIKQYFRDYYALNSDFTVSLKDGETKMQPVEPLDWSVSVVDTGALTMTGGRLKRLRSWIADSTFMCTYSDGVGNVDIKALVEFHKSHGKLATVTAVQPPARFGGLEITGDLVTDFAEKVHKTEMWINGGFFVFEPGVLDYVPGDEEPLEMSPLMNLAKDGQLCAFKHRGFWHPMDTIRDRNHLESLSKTDTPPWRDFAAGGGS